MEMRWDPQHMPWDAATRKDWNNNGFLFCYLCSLFIYMIKRCLFAKEKFFLVLKCRGTHFQWRRTRGRKLTCTAPFFSPQNLNWGPSFSPPFSVPCQERNSMMLPPHLPAAWLVWDHGSKIICLHVKKSMLLLCCTWHLA